MGDVAAPASGSIPPLDVVVGVGEGSEPLPDGSDDELELPQPERASRVAAARPVKRSRRMPGA
jgi:hypothetical protein